MADTIAAISTAVQKSGIAIIRISGDDALSVADKVFSGKKSLKDAKSHSMNYGKVIFQGEVVDECLCSVMLTPNSYTKENVVEINVHGGIISAERTLKAVLASGARIANAGEFTLRAFLNGRMDLSQAEAVADIIDSKTGLAQSVAVNQLQGKLTNGINEIRAEIIKILGLISVSTDFPDEDVDSLSGEDTKEKLIKLLKSVNKLIENADKGKILREGALCAICGRPNVGKSSLLNCLSGEERAIVTEIAGTTRDIIEEYINIKGIPVRLGDTAGIRENTGKVETIGVKKAVEYIKNADLCLFLIDAGELFTKDDAEIYSMIKDKPHITVINKTDLDNKALIPDEIDNKIYISVKDKKGIEELENKIHDTILGGNFSSDDVMITNTRHKEAVRLAKEELESAINALDTGFTPDMAAINLENAANHLGKITGMTVSDEVIHEIFSKFCLGK
ncbi:MAG: tRNA uridine-5-carboxymethylaminomethyl(34) synthesis GTPase MnmE [Bacillota bacterium]|nr:tRNA uridine-5-carboxymethylaminomethyl(34) synthesis GTPase MnmE [Bacillota bacterium]